MRYIYTLLFYLALPFLWLRILWKSRHAPSLRKRWKERLGFIPDLGETKSIWVHAVSLGEVKTAIPLIQELLILYPEFNLIVTTTTATGASQIKKQFPSEVKHFFLPYDIPHVIKRFLTRSHAAILIIMETEIWPNLLYHLHQNKIPIFLANARLAEKSFRGYQNWERWIAPILNYFNKIASQTNQDQERFIKLGVVADKVIVSGNMKFDVCLPDALFADAEKLRIGFNNRPIWVAASTHAGEEMIILDAFTHLHENYPDLLLILIPRHPERFEKIAYLCEKYGYKICKRSEMNAHCDAEANILLGDTIGELNLFYAASDIAFVGGSLVYVGGHNLIEPAALKKPIITGPYLHNFAQIAQLLLQHGALNIVHNRKELIHKVTELLQNPQEVKVMGMHAYEVSQANKGALSKNLDCIVKMIEP